VVKGDHTVGVRAITVGVTHGEESSVESGLVPDDLVVVDGAEKLRDGTKVEIRAPRDAPPPATGLPPTVGDEPRKGSRS
jgi:multidrug efflux system membrane fusion protein